MQTPLSAADFKPELIIAGVSTVGEGPVVDVVNPATEDILASVPTATLDQVDAAVASARSAFDDGPWVRMSRSERSGLLHRYADILEKNADRLLATIVSESGATVGLRSMHLDAPLAQMRWAAEMAMFNHEEQLGPDVRTPSSFSFVRHVPVGVVAAITPFNAPLHAVTIKLAALLAAGCTTVIKASPVAPLTAFELGRFALEAGLPDGVVNVLTGDIEPTQRLIASPGVDIVSFTGSVEVGKKVMAQAAAGLKRVILELGGKNPNLILPDADIAANIEAIHGRYLRNAGQGCGSPTRILVHESMRDEFLELSRTFFSQIKVGDPFDSASFMGPVISRESQERIEGFIATGVAQGAQVVAGGSRPPFDRGFWVSPTLLDGVTREATIAQEEIFGPVGSVLTYKDIDECVEIANDTKYGLGASIFTESPGLAIELSERLRAGFITVNGGGLFRPDVPHGGFKLSGIGREYGVAGIREFLEAQSVTVRI